jgi:hypothetical protein
MTTDLQGAGVVGAGVLSELQILAICSEGEMQARIRSIHDRIAALVEAARPFNIYPNRKPESFNNIGKLSAYQFTIAEILTIGKALGDLGNE